MPVLTTPVLTTTWSGAMIRVLILAVLLLPTAALAQAVTYADRSGTITAGGTAQVAIPAWSGRHGCMMAASCWPPCQRP
jgi:hypothetical protein